MRTLIGMGSNTTGLWGTPQQTLCIALKELKSSGISLVAMSPLYMTRPQGRRNQPSFLNAVASVQFHGSTDALLRLCKRIERAAGRRRGAPNSPRPLDLDIIDAGGRIAGWPPSRRRSRLVLPHPEAHCRRFVLLPLLEVAPRWRHPALKRSGRDLLARLPHDPVAVQRVLDSTWASCDTGRSR